MATAIVNHPTEDMASVINSVESRYLRTMTDDEIRRGIIDSGDRFKHCLPGQTVSDAGATDLKLALVEAGAMFNVELCDLKTDGAFEIPLEINKATVAVYNTGKREAIRAVGSEYPVIQTLDQLQALNILVEQGDLRIASVQKLRKGGAIKVTAVMGVSSFKSHDGAPNTLGHFATFTINHEGRGHNIAEIFTVRLECFNGMTTRQSVQKHKIRHSKDAAGKIEEMTAEIIEYLIQDVEDEANLLSSLVDRAMTRQEYTGFVDELLGTLPEDASDLKQNNRASMVDELLAGWDSGNQGAGETRWGAFNSVTGLQGQRIRSAENDEAAAAFVNGAINGAAQTLAADALELLLVPESA